MNFVQQRENTIIQYYETRKPYVFTLDILLVLLVVVAVSLGVYFYFFYIEEISNIRIYDVSHKTSIITGTLVPTKSKLQVSFKCSNISELLLLVSTDKSNSVFQSTDVVTINAANRVGYSDSYVVEWLVPEFIFSKTCQLKIQSKQNVSIYALSPIFEIKPIFSLVDIGSVADKEYYVPGLIQIRYDGVQALSPKFDVYYSEVQTITDPNNAEVNDTFIQEHKVLPDGCFYDNDLVNSTMVVYLTSDMVGKSVYLQLVTNNLTSYYDKELIVETLNKVAFTNVKFSGSYVNSSSLSFESLVVSDDISAVSGGTFSPGQIVWVSYKLSGGALSDSDIMWLLKIGDSDYAETSLTNSNNGFYQWVIPSNVYPTFNLRLTSRSNQAAYIDSGKLKCDSSLVISRCIVNCSETGVNSVTLICSMSGIDVLDIRNSAKWKLTNSVVTDTSFDIDSSIIYIPATKRLEITATNLSSTCLSGVSSVFSLVFDDDKLSGDFVYTKL